MGIQSPKSYAIQPQSDYRKQLHELKKNHHRAISHLKEVRGRAAEYEKTGGHGFVSYKAAALGACSLQAVKLSDGQATWAFINSIKGTEEQGAFHIINAYLDALIEKMSNEIPVTSPKEGSSPIQVVQNQTQSQTQNMQLVIDVARVIEKNLLNPNTTPQEKTFLEKVSEILPTINGGFDLLQKVTAIATQLGISIEAVSRLLR